MTEEKTIIRVDSLIGFRSKEFKPFFEEMNHDKYLLCDKFVKQSGDLFKEFDSLKTFDDLINFCKKIHQMGFRDKYLTEESMKSERNSNLHNNITEYYRKIIEERLFVMKLLFRKYVRIYQEFKTNEIKNGLHIK